MKLRISPQARTAAQQRRELAKLGKADLCSYRHIDLTFEDMLEAVTTLAIDLTNLMPSEVLRGVVVRHTEAFAGGSIASVTLSVGVSGSPTKYTAAHTISGAPGETNFQSTGCFGVERMGGKTPTPLVATLTSTGADLEELTAGQVSIYALIGHVG